MEEHKLQFSYQAHFYQVGKVTPQTKQIWFVLHGYGQLARYFIQKFTCLEQYQVCVIAPEGLSKFYLENIDKGGRSSNRVGATWMTKENREAEIENYLQYLNAVYQNIVPPNNQIPITILGFSQGAATASRWVLHNKITFDKLILWAGLLPPDMELKKGREIFQQKRIYFIYGDADPFLTDSRFEEMKKLASDLGVEPTTITFSGQHEIHTPTLEALL